MKASLNVLTKDEIERIHGASINILEKTGIKIYSEKVRNLLANYGAEVIGDLVKIPRFLIEESLKKAPKEIVLAAREPKYDLKIPRSKYPFVATSGFSTFTEDLETGIKRSSTLSDLKDYAVLSDYLNAVDFFWPIVVPTDKPPALQDLYALFVSFINNRKHIQHECKNEKTAIWAIELASVLVGGKENLRKRPIFSSVNCPVAPLTFEKGSSEAVVTLAKAGIPIAPMSMCLAGGTSPITLAGTLAVANAEQLASLVITQCSSPGAPMIYTAEISVMDRRSGEISYTAPEFTLLCAACAQLAKFYELPNFTSDVPLEVIPTDLLSFERNVVHTALHLMIPTDICAWLGSRERAKSASLIQLILDAEACEHAKAYLREFEINDDTLALEVINKVGPGGHFLTEKHTIEHFRKEIWLKDLSETFYLDPGEGSYLERAKKKVKEIISTHKVPIEESIVKELEIVLQKAQKDIMVR